PRSVPGAELRHGVATVRLRGVRRSDVECSLPNATLHSLVHRVKRRRSFRPARGRSAHETASLVPNELVHQHDDLHARNIATTPPIRASTALPTSTAL